jgi:hypothetical protein
MIAELGFATHVLDNPDPIHGPVLIGTRIEDASLLIVLIYGHGDVVRAMPERWRPSLDPWTPAIEGDRIYRRGVVDNKCQHPSRSTNCGTPSKPARFWASRRVALGGAESSSRSVPGAPAAD